MRTFCSDVIALVILQLNGVLQFAIFVFSIITLPIIIMDNDPGSRSSGEKRKKKSTSKSGSEKRKLKEKKERYKIAESCSKLTSYFGTGTDPDSSASSSTAMKKSLEEEKSQDVEQMNLIQVCIDVVDLRLLTFCSIGRATGCAFHTTLHFA